MSNRKIIFTTDYKFPNTRLKFIRDCEPYITPKGKSYRKIVCECDCGNIIECRADHVRKGRTYSCGCYHRERSKKSLTKHGLYKKHKRLCQCYYDMIHRCDLSLNGNESYKKLGITVCPEWAESIESFVSWALSNGYRSDLTIERRNTLLGYFPKNCYWAGRKIQTNNRTISLKCCINGVDYESIEEASKALDTNYHSIYYRCNSDNYPNYKLEKRYHVSTD